MINSEGGWPTTDAFNHAVSAEVRAALARKRMKQKDIGALTGWSRNYLSKRVVGDIPWGIADLTTVCDILGVDMGELIGTAKRRALRGDGGEDGLGSAS